MNKPIILALLLLLLCGGWWSCRKKYPAEPVIEFKSVSKESLLQGTQDSLFLEFSFTDGDGDIGSDSDDHIYIRDSRDSSVFATYKIPDYTGKEHARKGTITLVVYAGCCVYPDSTSCYANANHPLDSMRYWVSVRDKAGHWSNQIQTPIIELECQ